MRHRSFKICINILFFEVYTNSRVHPIKNNFVMVYLSIWYTIIALFLGWWGTGFLRPFRSFSNTVKAIHINLTGGEDLTQEMNDTEYDDKTNYVWNNLLRETTETINKNVIEIIIEIQENFEITHSEFYNSENINYINSNLNKIEHNSLTSNELNDIFDALKLYSNTLELEPVLSSNNQYRF